MIVYLSGEGIGDLGACNDGHGHCDGDSFTYGPLTVIVDNILETKLNYSLLQVPGSYRYISRKFLSVWSKENQPRMRPSRGICSPPEMGIYRSNSFALAEIANEAEIEENQKTIAILFRDVDGTGSSPRNIWKLKLDAIHAGFAIARYAPRGVAMLPMPKSEGWLICAAKDTPYQDCHLLEELPGNDNAPNSMKEILNSILKGRDSAEEVREWLIEQPYDHDAACQMPSFAKFREELLQAVTDVIARQ
jgi:hypothetical protein